MNKEHRYSVSTKWAGNLGSGTSRYDAYGRDYVLHLAATAGIVVTDYADAAEGVMRENQRVLSDRHRRIGFGFTRSRSVS